MALADPAQGQAILNVERLLTNEAVGLHATVSGRLSLAKGNTDVVQFGSDLMLEEERLKRSALGPNEEAVTRDVRVANLMTLSGQAGEGNRWIAVLYFQPAANDPGDYRVLGELGWSSRLSNLLDLDFGLGWRRDSRPPSDLRRDDFATKLGLTFRVE